MFDFDDLIQYDYSKLSKREMLQITFEEFNLFGMMKKEKEEIEFFKNRNISYEDSKKEKAELDEYLRINNLNSYEEIQKLRLGYAPFSNVKSIKHLEIKKNLLRKERFNALALASFNHRNPYFAMMFQALVILFDPIYFLIIFLMFDSFGFHILKDWWDQNLYYDFDHNYSIAIEGALFWAFLLFKGDSNKLTAVKFLSAIRYLETFP